MTDDFSGVFAFPCVVAFFPASITPTLSIFKVFSFGNSYVACMRFSFVCSALANTIFSSWVLIVIWDREILTEIEVFLFAFGRLLLCKHPPSIGV